MRHDEGIQVPPGRESQSRILRVTVLLLGLVIGGVFFAPPITRGPFASFRSADHAKSILWFKEEDGDFRRVADDSAGWTWKVTLWRGTGGHGGLLSALFIDDIQVLRVDADADLGPDGPAAPAQTRERIIPVFNQQSLPYKIWPELAHERRAVRSSISWLGFAHHAAAILLIVLVFSAVRRRRLAR